MFDVITARHDAQHLVPCPGGRYLYEYYAYLQMYLGRYLADVRVAKDSATGRYRLDWLIPGGEAEQPPSKERIGRELGGLRRRLQVASQECAGTAASGAARMVRRSMATDVLSRLRIPHATDDVKFTKSGDLVIINWCLKNQGNGTTLGSGRWETALAHVASRYRTRVQEPRYIPKRQEAPRQRQPAGPTPDPRPAAPPSREPAGVLPQRKPPLRERLAARFPVGTWVRAIWNAAPLIGLPFMLILILGLGILWRHEAKQAAEWEADAKAFQQNVHLLQQELDAALAQAKRPPPPIPHPPWDGYANFDEAEAIVLRSRKTDAESEDRYREIVLFQCPWPFEDKDPPFRSEPKPRTQAENTQVSASWWVVRRFVFEGEKNSYGDSTWNNRRLRDPDTYVSPDIRLVEP